MDTQIIESGCMRGNKAASQLGYVVYTQNTQYQQHNNPNTYYFNPLKSLSEVENDLLSELNNSSHKSYFVGNETENHINTSIQLINSKYYVRKANFFKAKKILDEYNSINEFSSQEALINLYDNLLNILNETETSDNFLNYIYKYKIDFSSDGFVHILNAFKPIKLNLSNYSTFVEYSFESMTNTIGLKRANQIIRIFS